MTSSLIKTRHTTTSPSCTTGPSPSTRMNQFRLSQPKSQSSTTSSASTLTLAGWIPLDSTGCITAVRYRCQSQLPLDFFVKNSLLNFQFITFVLQLALSPFWINVLLSMQTFVGWSKPLRMMLTGPIPKAVLVQKITHFWEGAEVRVVWWK